jgi:hypothetical protein
LLGGNWPAGYYIYPNQLQLDQVVAIAERLPDTVQKDHIDWGFAFRRSMARRIATPRRSAFSASS